MWNMHIVLLTMLPLGLLFAGVIGLARARSKSDGQRVFTIAVWRHGERAPDHHLSMPSNAKFFPLGVKELTERGIERSFNLGRFFRERYLDGVFMSRTLNNSEVHIRSVERDRCMMTATAVAQGMYSDSGRAVPLPVPIHSPEEATDFTLALPWKKCPILAKQYQEFCQFPEMDSFASFQEFERKLFNCSKAGKGKKYFSTVRAFDEIESLLAEEFAGADLPDWYTPDIRQEAKDVYYQVTRFLLGLGEYHNPSILRAQGGLLLDTIISQLQLKWKCMSDYSKECTKMQKLKFKGFSTQDFILNTILQSLGARDAALGPEQNTLYSSAILFELWNVDGQPRVKVLYKRYHNDKNLWILTESVRTCPGRSSTCPLDDFARCCPEYRTTDPMAACNSRYKTPPQARYLHNLAV